MDLDYPPLGRECFFSSSVYFFARFLMFSAFVFDAIPRTEKCRKALEPREWLLSSSGTTFAFGENWSNNSDRNSLPLHRAMFMVFQIFSSFQVNLREINLIYIYGSKASSFTFSGGFNLFSSCKDLSRCELLNFIENFSLISLAQRENEENLIKKIQWKTFFFLFSFSFSLFVLSSLLIIFGC